MGDREGDGNEEFDSDRRKRWVLPAEPVGRKNHSGIQPRQPKTRAEIGRGLRKRDHEEHAGPMRAVQTGRRRARDENRSSGLLHLDEAREIAGNGKEYRGTGRRENTAPRYGPEKLIHAGEEKGRRGTKMEDHKAHLTTDKRQQRPGHLVAEAETTAAPSRPPPLPRKGQ